MSAIVFALPGNETMAGRLVSQLPAERGELAVRTFPDSESYVRIMSDCMNRRAIIVDTLDHADPKLLPLLFAAETIRELGASQVGLIAPYLGYMRQDQRFNTGEAVTSRSFAAIISERFDWLVTVDPHLHRFHSLSELYSIQSTVVHAAPAVGAWIRANVKQPLVVGPDIESTQWVEQVAAVANSPHVSLSKTRYGDRDVRIALPDLSRWTDHDPVLVDDIISSAHTMAEAAKGLLLVGMKVPKVVGVHGVFAKGAQQALTTAGVDTIVTSNTIAHPSNQIDVSEAIADAIRTLLWDA